MANIKEPDNFGQPANHGLSINPRELWASSELCWDPEYQPSMDAAWSGWNQDIHRVAKEVWEQKISDKEITRQNGCNQYAGGTK